LTQSYRPLPLTAACAWQHITLPTTPLYNVRAEVDHSVATPLSHRQ